MLKNYKSKKSIGLQMHIIIIIIYIHINMHMHPLYNKATSKPIII